MKDGWFRPTDWKRPGAWLRPTPSNPWFPFVSDRMALEIVEAEIMLLECGQLR